MGQIVTALMVGAKITPEFEKKSMRNGELIWWELDLDTDPQTDEEFTVAGFPYAISRGNEDGCARLESHALSELPTLYPEEQARARARWAQFVMALEKKRKGIVVPPTEILLAQIEVG